MFILEEETYQYYAIITKNDPDDKEDDENVMYLTFEQEKLENNVTKLNEVCNEPSTSNIEFVNVSVKNDEDDDDVDDVSVIKNEGIYFIFVKYSVWNNFIYICRHQFG